MGYVGVAEGVIEEGGKFLGLFAVSLAEEDIDELLGGVVHLTFF
jgi:hypothetical protein